MTTELLPTTRQEADELLNKMELQSLLEASLIIVRSAPGIQHDYRLDSAIQKLQSILAGTMDAGTMPMLGSELMALIAAGRVILQQTPCNEVLVFAVAKLERLAPSRRVEELARV
jgi:hypothetical protein